jgi:hypothetical protein
LKSALKERISLDVLEHQLPVARYALAHIAEHGELAAAEDAVEIAQHQGAEIILECLGRGGERGEDDAVPPRHAQALQPVRQGVEIVRHAALPLVAAAERHAEQRAAEIVGPLVIGADEFLGIAEFVLAEGNPAMGAAIDHDVDRAARIAYDDDRFVADRAALEVAGMGNLRLERDIGPGRAGEDALLLQPVDLGIAVEPERHARGRPFRPMAARCRRIVRQEHHRRFLPSRPAVPEDERPAVPEYATRPRPQGHKTG